MEQVAQRGLPKVQGHTCPSDTSFAQGRAWNASYKENTVLSLKGKPMPLHAIPLETLIVWERWNARFHERGDDLLPKMEMKKASPARWN